jgi:hypothetical protein
MTELVQKPSSKCLDGTGYASQTQEGVTDIKPVVQRKESRIRTNLAVAQLGPPTLSCSAEEAPAYVANGNNGTAYTYDHPCNQMDDLHICKPIHKNRDGQ